ncbi:MAG: hypothetical protein M3Q10_08345, partial [Chloroflexota bacterium]|nr:hypothetical protein [Chloroflexota bacterium]
MYTLLIDGAPYKAYTTPELAEAARTTLKRWSSTSTRFEVVPVRPVPVACGACRGSGVAVRLTWSKGWTHAPGPCRGCGGSGA